MTNGLGQQPQPDLFSLMMPKKRNHSPDMHFDKGSKRNARVTEIQLMHGQDRPSSFNKAKPTEKTSFYFCLLVEKRLNLFPHSS